MWGAYDVSRIASETGWKPRPVREALHAYLDWIISGATRASMNSPDPYPRDLVGYGANPPHPRWPHEARIAVSIVLNYEEGGESCVLHGDACSESVLTDVGGEAVQGARNLNVESTFEYGSRVGFWEIMGLLKDHGVRCDDLRRRHGFGAKRRSGRGDRAQRPGSCLSRAALDRLSVRSRGGRTRRHGAQCRDHHTPDRTSAPRLVLGPPSPNTRRLVVEIGGFLYDSDAYNDDLPYWTHIGGRPHLVIPHTFDANDSRLQRGGDFATAEDFFIYCRDAFDWLYRKGAEGQPRMMTISLHGRIIGRPGRIQALWRASWSTFVGMMASGSPVARPLPAGLAHQGPPINQRRGDPR